MVYIVANLKADVSSRCNKTDLAVLESTEPNSTVCSSEDTDRVEITVLTIFSTQVDFGIRT